MSIKKQERGGGIFATIPKVNDDIPIVILFRALGCISDKQIVNRVLNDPNDTAMSEAFRPSLEAAGKYYTQEACLEFIGSLGGALSVNIPREDRIAWTRRVLRDDLLPHVGISEGDEFKKAYFTGYMCNRLIQAALGRTTEDDRDYYGKKRLDMAGSLLAMIFRAQFRMVIKDMEKLLEKEINSPRFKSDNNKLNMYEYIKSDTITRGLRTALATGNWGKDKDNNTLKTGVSQVLSRLTFASFLSHLRRVTTPLDKKGKQTKPRQLHNSHWGMVCPAETPEGGSCGLVKNLTLMAQISVGQKPSELIQTLYDFGVEPLKEDYNYQNKRSDKVFLNGQWIGNHNYPSELLREIREMRRKNQLPKEYSILRDIDKREIKIYTDSGRCLRAMFIVENNELTLRKKHVEKILKQEWNFEQFFRHGLIELLDVEEEESAMIAMFVQDIDTNRKTKKY